MPASEKTWRNQKTLHVIFGCTGLLLLVSTLWMFASDHRREWKQYQRKMRNVDVRLTDWRMQAELTQANADQQAQLNDALAEELSTAPPKQAFELFASTVADESQRAELNQTYSELSAETDPERGASLRSSLDEQIDSIVALAEFEERSLLSRRKFKSADYDEKRANYDLGIRDARSQEVLDALQAEVDEERDNRAELTKQYQAASDYRRRLSDARRLIGADAAEVQKQIDDLQAEYNRLASSKEERDATYFVSSPPFLGKKWLEVPIVDAFNSPLKIDNLWTKNLEITNGSFGTVTRYDRCTTCHQSIAKSAPGSAVDPLYEAEREIELALATPEARPTAEEAGEGEPTEPTLLSVYGLSVAKQGLVDSNAVTIRQVLPNSFAANATSETEGEGSGLRVGDVLAFVQGSKVLSIGDAERFLLEEPEWGEPVSVVIKRGLPQPFNSHPRLDLFVGSLSPHKLSDMGCSVCHEGQGSATAFKFASHTPNDPEQQEEWAKDHGWFNNHHWIYPMFPKRFAESTCLKCHHDVVELELADQFEEPPAPKLTQGYHLIEKYGCYGCHEINGYAGADTRVGPDMRLEPNFFAAAAQLKADPNFNKLDPEHQEWIDQLVHHPERDGVRHELLEALKLDAEKTRPGSEEEPILSPYSHEMIAVLSDIETPGDLRKVGPSLRHVAQKMGPTFLYDWLRDPTAFRASTRMPRFFGLHDHLDEGEKATAEKYEPIEILGILTYLLDKSQNVELLAVDEAMFAGDEEQVERGKLAFEVRGCLACHQHGDFPRGEAVHGPDLSNIGDKFSLGDTPDARRWFYSWLKNPSNYHPRTKMPDLYLDPIEDKEGNKTDPAADIAVYLLKSSNGWKPADESIAKLKANPADLDALVREHLATKLFEKDVDDVLANGSLPESLARGLVGAEAALVGELSENKKLNYIGEKTISKYGCYACHDIPGFEGAKPIGTGLADWGRKDPSKLAFEHIAEYLAHGHGHGGHDGGHSADDHAADAHSEHTDEAHGENHDEHSMHDAEEVEIDESFYMARILEHDRAGFAWQKLKEPRSYDYGKARNKDSFNDRLRMPLFPFNDEEREAVLTFVLGLLAEPPAYEFVYHADEKQQAIIDGHKALTKFNCVGCHIVEPEKWTLELASGLFPEQDPQTSQTFPFSPHRFTTDEVAESETTDRYRGVVTATLAGMPDISSETAEPMILDEEGDEWTEDSEYEPYLYPFLLWEPTVIDGNPYQVSGPGGVPQPIEIEKPWIKSRKPAYGGDLTFLLLPRAIELEKEANPDASGKQAYGWLPPPLLGEGAKVQTDWLHSFLLDPFPIRPAVLLRMPKFNMSPAESADLVNYFAAKDNVDYPYEFSPATQGSRLAAVEQEYETSLADAETKPEGESRFDHAMNIVTSNSYCVQCHMVGDFVPATSERAMAPDLSEVNRRLRPDYLRRWLANPGQILPYTPMPVNVKYNADAPHLGGVAQDLYHGTSIEQLDALVDLLMNYPEYSKSRADVSSLVKPAEAGADDTAAVEN